ncbi:tetratricopeptide (TPR) repeat protein [Hamadaea flava]|uniref:Tetratricopeptide repeat protein n=1 Tax=Hamadaea flava TaxID=1742688 RepID=A0ABV8M0C6_9ACTN|nr:tetratricopeptide repeat protein [Hamadaea flava]MCP2322174.1 tetratricopeptide (TPR) repeat protein [Hamadaea flava]
MRVSWGDSVPEPPDPRSAGTIADLVERLRLAKVYYGDPSVRDIARMVNQTRAARSHRSAKTPPTTPSTIGYLFDARRVRLDVNLMVDVLQVIGVPPPAVRHWVQAWRVVTDTVRPERRVAASRELPAPPLALLGRDAELSTMLSSAKSVVVYGMPGVGKTALALRVAHEVTRRHGQQAVHLYADVGAIDDGDVFAGSDEIGGELLQALGVPVPSSGDAIWHALATHLQGRDCVVVLDNIGALDQIAPIVALPGTRVIATSRRRLESTARILAVPLHPLAVSESVDLLVRVSGWHEPAVDQTDLLRICELCGNLPLALTTAAAFIRKHPDWTIADHADRLAELTVFPGLHAAFQSSYRSLSAPARRLLRLLSLHPGRAIAAPAVRALCGEAPARRVLEELVGASLLDRAVGGRYAIHDLVQAFGRDRALDEERPASRRAALHRLVTSYVELVHAAATSEPDQLLSGTPDTVGAWWQAERSNLAAAIALASHLELAAETLAIARDCWIRQDMTGDFAAGLAFQEYAVRAAATMSDATAEAEALYRRGMLRWRSGAVEAGVRDLESALVTLGGIETDLLRARIHNGLGVILMSDLRYAEASEHYTFALEVYRKRDDLPGQANVLGNLGVCRMELGDLDDAAAYMVRALSIFERTGNRRGLGRSTGNLGEIHLDGGRPAEAVPLLETAVRLHQDHGNVYDASYCLASLGVARAGCGDLGQAAADIERAAALSTGLTSDHLNSHLQRRSADVALARGDRQTAEAAYRQSLATAHRARAGWTVLCCEKALAELTTSA